MLWNAILLALTEIRRNVIRTFLTLLGVVIGVGSVVVMVTIGAGTAEKVNRQMADFGKGLLIITPAERVVGKKSKSAKAFTLSDVSYLQSNLVGVEYVIPIESKQERVVRGNRNWMTNVVGSTNDYFNVARKRFSFGKGFTVDEVRVGSSVCVVGETVREKLFGNRSPVGAKIRLDKISCVVVGVMSKKGQSIIGRDLDNEIVIPIGMYHRKIAGNRDINLIQVQAAEGFSSGKVQKNIIFNLRLRRNISGARENDFSVMDLHAVESMIKGASESMNAQLVAVAAISLLVGGIGIMNMMLISVTERTREIGTRMAIGALGSDVMLQFVVEALVVSTIGGGIGVLLAVFVSYFVVLYMGLPFVFNFQVVLLAFVMSLIVGLCFGYLPARKAAKLHPVEALKY